MLGQLRERAIHALPLGSWARKVARAAFLPLSISVGTAYRIASRRFTRPGIVIGGAGRSGTTLLLSVLAAHPHIFAVDHETYAFCPREFEEKPESPANFQLYRLYTPLALSTVSPTVTRWAEKTARNVHFFAAILDYFGDDVRVLHLVRDGRDVITSRHPRRPDQFYYSPDKWIRCVHDGLQFDDDPRVKLVHYEDLVGDFENTIRDICAFLDEPCGEEILNWHEHTSVRRHAAWTGNVRPLHDDSVHRWQAPEFANRVAEFTGNAEAVELLDRLGYPNRPATYTKA